MTASPLRRDAGNGKEHASPSHESAYAARRGVQIAWAVHVLTASGVVVGYLALTAVGEGRARGAILWLLVALFVDGVDGPLARRIDASRRVPHMSGQTLDLVVDYFTCAIVPVAFLTRFDMLPPRTSAVVSIAILVTGVLWMGRSDQETEDGWFRGFPGEWNLIIPTLFLADASPWVNLVVCAVLAALQLSVVEFPHPVAVRELRAVTIGFMAVWLGSMLLLASWQRDIALLEAAMLGASAWTVWQVARRRWEHTHSTSRVR
jgi:phosphatidylcholine synthase